MMTDPVDALLYRLKTTPPDRDLGRLESAVWSRIDRTDKSDVFGGRTWQVQIAVTCGALLLGLLVAQLAGSDLVPRPLNSEIVVLSDDGQLAPSVRLEGGI
jgi:hypothetical protein